MIKSNIQSQSDEVKPLLSTMPGINVMDMSTKPGLVVEIGDNEDSLKQINPSESFGDLERILNMLNGSM